MLLYIIQHSIPVMIPVLAVAATAVSAHQLRNYGL
jgi:hypothetical protein